jgi:hypothetical protein
VSPSRSVKTGAPPISAAREVVPAAVEVRIDAAADVHAQTTIVVARCVPSPLVQWTRGPGDALSCSQMVTSRDPLTIAVAPSTPVKMTLSARRTAEPKAAFGGSFRASALPAGASLDSRSGRFTWTARAEALPFDIGFAAALSTDGGEDACAIDALHVELADSERTRGNLMRWTFYEALRDAELDEIEITRHVGPEGVSAFDSERLEAEAAANAQTARAKYMAELTGCGRLPGGAYREADVDGDTRIDGVFAIDGPVPRSLVLRRGSSGFHRLPIVRGAPRFDKAGGGVIFVAETGAEGTNKFDVSWFTGDELEQASISGDRAATLDGEFDEHGGVNRLILLLGSGARKAWIWHEHGLEAAFEP